MKRYAQLIKELKAKNLADTQIKEAILEKAKEEINHFNFNFKGFKVKEAGTEKKSIEIEGYASTKDIDRYGDVVEPTAFDETMELFMKNPVLLLQHDHNKRIGDVTEYEIDSNGLYIKADVKYNAGDDELFDKIEGKSLKGFSIGWRILEAEWKEVEDENGMIIDYIFIVKKLDLVEISVVNVPANPYTLMKSIQDLAIKSFEGAVKDAIEDDENKNENDNQEDNANNNDEEKELKVDLKDEKLEDPEANNDGGDIEVDAEDKEIKEEENNSGKENEDNPEEKKLDDTEEKDNIKNDNPENLKEEKDSEKAGGTEQEKSITTKAIEKIVEAKISGNEKAFKTLVEKEIKNLSENFTKELKAVKSELEKELDAIVELVKEVKETESEIVERIKSTVKGKGFINFKTTEQKKTENTRLSYILSGVKNNKF